MTCCIKLAILAISLLVVQTGYAYTLAGRVVKVVDGDTIDVLDANKSVYRIRLAGIDAPEKSQAFGTVSKKALSDLVYGQDVTIDTYSKDRNDRYIGIVLFNGKDINLVQVKTGMAWYYVRFGFKLLYVDQQKYSQSEIDARSSHIGLWADPNPTPPWDYRKSKPSWRAWPHSN